MSGERKQIERQSMLLISIIAYSHIEKFEYHIPATSSTSLGSSTTGSTPQSATKENIIFLLQEMIILF